MRVQLDGVGTNWGRITFAHITNLVKMGVLGNTVVARNPVGNTHEDIDAIFAILRNHLIDLDVFSPSELDAAIRAALDSYSLPIFIKHVDGTRDRKTAAKMLEEMSMDDIGGAKADPSAPKATDEDDDLLDLMDKA